MRSLKSGYRLDSRLKTRLMEVLETSWLVMPSVLPVPVGQTFSAVITWRWVRVERRSRIRFIRVN
jgi:hypothetical protein